TLTTRMLGEAASSPVLERSANVLPPVASARIGRWGVRKAEPLITAAAAGGAAGAAAAAGVAQGRVRGEEGESASASGVRVPAPLDKEQQGAKGVARKVPAARKGDAPPLNLGGANGRAGAAGRGPVRSGGAAAGPAAAGGPRGVAAAGGPRGASSSGGSGGS